jgi:hypothetical protein
VLIGVLVYLYENKKYVKHQKYSFQIGLISKKDKKKTDKILLLSNYLYVLIELIHLIMWLIHLLISDHDQIINQLT